MFEDKIRKDTFFLIRLTIQSLKVFKKHLLKKCHKGEGQKSAKKCLVLFEWRLFLQNVFIWKKHEIE